MKAILLACDNTTVVDALAVDLQNLERGTARDELQWLDVQLHACRILNAHGSIVFVTSEQLKPDGSLITLARQDGYSVVIVPHPLASKLSTLQDVDGQPVRTLEVYRNEWNEGFQFIFVSPDQLTLEERAIYEQTRPLMHLLSSRIVKVKEVLISETMRLNRYNNNEVAGVWEEAEERIIIKREQLRRRDVYAATLLHEYIHALSGADDETLEFEYSLTEALGVLADDLFSMRTARE